MQMTQFAGWMEVGCAVIGFVWKSRSLGHGEEGAVAVAVEGMEVVTADRLTAAGAMEDVATITLVIDIPGREKD